MMKWCQVYVAATACVSALTASASQPGEDPLVSHGGAPSMSAQNIPVDKQDVEALVRALQQNRVFEDYLSVEGDVSRLPREKTLAGWRINSVLNHWLESLEHVRALKG